MSIRSLSPGAAAVDPQGLQPTSGPFPMWIVILAAAGYGGYRVYKHFKKG